MKKTIILIVIFWIKGFCAFSQTLEKKESVYFLLTKELMAEKKDSMLQFDADSTVMFAKILCPCLKDGEMPILAYHLDKEDAHLREDQITNYKLISLPGLILKCKAALMRIDNVSYTFFLLEKNKEDYVVRKAKLTQTRTVN